MQGLGWLGAIALALCGLPQAIRCVRQGHAEGLSPLMVASWFIGEVCLIVATLGELGWVWWLLFNYGANILCLLVIIKYMVWPNETVR